MEKFTEYIDLYFPALGMVFLAITGGVVAHIKDWESMHPDMTWRNHCWALLRRGIMAALAGLIWYYVAKQWAWNGQPFAYAGASVVGLFAPEFFDLMWTIVRERLLLRSGVSVDGDMRHIDPNDRGDRHAYNERNDDKSDDDRTPAEKAADREQSRVTK